MASSGGSTNPIRERSDGDQVVIDIWDVVYGTKVDKKMIFPDIDPEGEYKVPTVLPAPRPPPAGAIMAAQAPLPIDFPDPLDLLILQGDMSVYHQRSPGEPPADFPEGEEVEEAESDEVAPLALPILLVHMRMHRQRSPEEPPADLPEGEEVEEAVSEEVGEAVSEGDVGSASTSVLPSKVTEGKVATLGVADNGILGAELEFCSVVEPHVPAAGPAKQQKCVGT